METPVALAQGRSFPSGIAADATHVYWVEQGSASHDGKVMRIAK